MRLILIAPPGAGKSVQAKKLIEIFKLSYTSTGSYFRKWFETRDSCGEYTKTQFEGGELCPDDPTNKIVEAFFKESDENWLLDGYPRTIPQAKFFHEKMIKQKLIYKVVLLDVPIEECKKRLLAGNKDRAGRADDKLEIIEKRFLHYEKLTAPLVTFYEGLELLVKQNGLGKPEDVARELETKLRAMKW